MVASLRTVEWMLDLSSNAFSITYLILWVAVFTRQICLPVPANLFLLTAGALPRGGGLNMSVVFVWGYSDVSLEIFSGSRPAAQWSSQIMLILCAFAATHTTVPNEPIKSSADRVFVL